MRCIVFATLLAIAYGASWRSRDADMYMDAVLQSQVPYEVKTSGLEPAYLSNFTDFVQTPTHGRVAANFSRGLLTGLSQIYRRGNCSGPNYFNRNITINCTLGFRSLKVSYDGFTRVQGYNRFQAVANVTNAYATVQVSSSPQSNRPALKSMVVYGLQFAPGTTAFQRALVDTLNKNVGTSLHNLVYGQFRPALQRSLQRVPMPLPTGR